MDKMAKESNVAEQDVLPKQTSDAQREILSSVALGDDASCAFNMAVEIDFHGRLNVAALAQAVTQLGQRHQMLRARFSADGETMQVDAESKVELQVLDLGHKNPEQAQLAVEQLRQREVSVAFDLLNEQAWRIKLVVLGDQDSCILITVHHVVADGWSLAVMRNDLESLYNATVDKVQPSLEPAVDFDDYLLYLDEQQNNGNRDTSRDYWIEQFSTGVPAFDFPLDHARPPQRTYAAGRCDARVPRDVADTLRKMARDQNNSLFNVLFSAFYSYLYRSSGADDLVVGIPAAGHSVAALYEMVGHCVNILPVRQKVSGDQPYSELLKLTRGSMLDAQDHQEFTFSELMGRLDLERDASRIPVVSMLFNIDQDPGLHNYHGLEGRAFTVPHRFENFEIFCNILDRRGDLTIEWAYNTQLFSAEATEHRVHSFVALLTQIAHAPNLALDDLSLFSAIDREIVDQVNSTQLVLPETATVLSMLESARCAYPEAEALVAGEVRFSYQALHDQSNRLANYLQAQGVEKGDWVALCLERNEHMVVAILALMKLGATYVPLDPAYPADRVAYIIANANASLIITQSHFLAALPEHSGSNICLDELASQLDKHSSLVPEAVPVSAEDLIYVIYTSGSTGNPKGVKLKHINVANFLTAMAQTPGLASSDRLVAVTTLSFDIAVLELMLPLTVGACVVVATRDQATDADALQALMAKERASTLQATPATWRMLFQGGWQGQRNLKALVGGEALPRDLALQLAASTDQLWNMYGPTETAIWSTCERISPDARSITIGRPIGNTKVYVLDERGHPAPVGLPGELLIGGEGVCAGYHQRDDLTRQVFIPDVFSVNPEARLYRTRDRVKLLPDGRLEYLERMDNQVKVRGYRIELGEIETVLSEQNGVADCAVLAREDNPGDVRLVAYVCLQQGALDERALSLGLRQRLPDFMQPQHYVLMQEMPRTPNGKLDRKALPAPQVGAGSDEREIVEPRTETEQWVAGGWASLIGVDSISVDDNFFGLGGHSLLAMRFIAESRKTFSGSISLRMLLSDTLAQIAATLKPEDKVDETVVSDKKLQDAALNVYFSQAESGSFYCAYHAPKGAAQPQRAVLIAQPLGHEYQRGHRAMQELSVALSRKGCAVLRFDYCNTGDSPGEPESLNLAQLQADLTAATDELCRLSGCDKVDLLSLRAGGLIASSVADKRWRHHFAWDPVVDGAQYHQLLKRLHSESLNDWDRYISLRADHESEEGEYVGYSYPTQLMEELAQVSSEALSSAQLILSAGESSPLDNLPVIAQLQVEPNWAGRDETETHLQMPADLALLLKTIVEAAR